MSKFIRNLSLFIAGLPAIFDHARAGVAPIGDLLSVPLDLPPVSLRPLNHDVDNLFAGHRSHSSHSSHSSHASHYSGSTGGYTLPITTLPQPEYRAPVSPPSNFVPISPSVSNQTLSNPTVKESPSSTAEKLRLQVMRVQISLTSLKFYDGRINGVLDDETKRALKNFQLVKGLAANGLMSTPTLNALGVPASN